MNGLEFPLFPGTNRLRAPRSDILRNRQRPSNHRADTPTAEAGRLVTTTDGVSATSRVGHRPTGGEGPSGGSTLAEKGRVPADASAGQGKAPGGPRL